MSRVLAQEKHSYSPKHVQVLGTSPESTLVLVVRRQERSGWRGSVHGRSITGANFPKGRGVFSHLFIHVAFILRREQTASLSFLNIVHTKIWIHLKPGSLRPQSPQTWWAPSLRLLPLLTQSVPGSPNHLPKASFPACVSKGDWGPLVLFGH